jgi:transitional endoplasmic reticulum ATPase
VPTTTLDKQMAKEAARIRDKILDNLAELGGNNVTHESGVAYHEGRQILIPELMSLKNAAKLLTAQAAAMEEDHEFQKVFPFRPWDGAYATQQVLTTIFGVGGQGKAQYDMFGNKYPPKFVNVEVAPGKEVRVPWGVVDFPLLEAEMATGYQNDPQKGALFQLKITCPKKYESQVEGLFIAIEQYLLHNSIYKGKAIVGVGKATREGFENPTFLDPQAIDPEKVAYAKDVFEQLTLAVWGPIRTAELQRRAGLKLNLKTLLYGPYGTGKSLAGGLTAKVASENGWTFVQCKTGSDDLNLVLRMAELYAPSVVFIEDIDILIETDPKKMADLLEQFDGVSSKNKEVMVLMTSNHVDSLSKGMTRAGRIDAAIEIGSLDVEGIQRLISSMFEPSMLDENIDWEAVYESMHEYEPAFIINTFAGAKNAGLIRTGSLEFTLTTEDFVAAANGLRTQHDTHSNAKIKPEADRLQGLMANLVRDEVRTVLDNTRVDFQEGGTVVKVEETAV